jgi:regulator of nucleoside diphosphate kinase
MEPKSPADYGAAWKLIVERPRTIVAAPETTLCADRGLSERRRALIMLPCSFFSLRGGVMSIHSVPVITELDAARIRELGARLPNGGEGYAAVSRLIEKVTQEADIVPGQRVAADVVTVNSTVSFRDELTGTEHRVTVVYPAEMSIAERRISVLSPVGSALLGRSVGAVTSFELPDGSSRRIRVLELHYQPEASGEYTR